MRGCSSSASRRWDVWELDLDLIIVGGRHHVTANHGDRSDRLLEAMLVVPGNLLD